MHYTGQIYRPPMEAETPLLEITAGCTHNKCAFCTMYNETPFRVSKLEDVKEDLAEMRQMYGKNLERIFLLNGDAFALPTEKLLKISEMAREEFPNIKTLSCYASIRNIARKSDEELRQLRHARYNDLYLGLESGWGPALIQMRKGFTIEDAYRELARLKEAGIRYGALLMFGIGGKGNGKENARETAKLLNSYMPFVISAVPTAIAPESDLAKMRDAGEYKTPTERELIEEEIMFLDGLDDGQECYFFGRHPYNTVPVGGFIKDRDRMTGQLKTALHSLSPQFLDSCQQRGHL